MGYKIYESKVYTDTIKISGEVAQCVAEFTFKQSRKDNNPKYLTTTAVFSIERGIELYRNDIKIIEGNGMKVKYSVSDDEFKEMLNFAGHKDKIPSVSTILQEELFCIAITEAGIHPGINNDPTITVKGETASCYGYFDFSDKSQLSMPMSYTEEEGFVLEISECLHLDVDLNGTLKEMEFEDNFKNQMYRKLFVYAAKLAGVERRLKYALTVSNSPNATSEKPVIKTVSKGPTKKEKGVNRYR